MFSFTSTSLASFTMGCRQLMTFVCGHLSKPLTYILLIKMAAGITGLIFSAKTRDSPQLSISGDVSGYHQTPRTLRRHDRNSPNVLERNSPLWSRRSPRFSPFLNSPRFSRSAKFESPYLTPKFTRKSARNSPLTPGLEEADSPFNS